MNLTARVYGLEYGIGMAFYGIGILLITPPTNNPLLKNSLILIVCLASVIGSLIQYKQTNEKFDERAKHNFMKASNVTLMILLFLLITGGTIIQLFNLNLIFSSGIAFFMLATLCVIHANAFRQLETSVK